MGISLNKSNVFTITDLNGNTKFSLDRKMPHIIHDISGTVTIPKILSSDDYDKYQIDRIDTVAVLSNTYIISSLEESIILPFYSITGGFSDTDGKIISGTGSTIVRKIFQPSTRDFLGCSILDIVAENGQLKLICNQHLDRTGSFNIDGDIDVTLSYRIYYGRFN